MKFMKSIKEILFIVLQCTWGIIPTLVGLFFFLKLKDLPHKTYRGCIDTRWNMRSGLSLGLFIFTPSDEIKDAEKIRVHEYGHCIQSIVLGPLFIILGIISLVWGRHPYFAKRREERNLRYTSCFVESWASKWGELVTGEEAVWD